jgi:glycerol-3-phosphate acyltransferase PlsY
MIQTYLIVAVVAYLLGSIPFGYILVKLFLKQDIRQTGSGNIGATNVARSGKKGLAIATLVLDAAKGFVALLVVSRYPQFFRIPPVFLEFGIPLYSLIVIKQYFPIAALFAVLGHCFPVWLEFKGGKGVATAVGAFAALAPKGVLVAFIAFIIIVTITRYISLGSVVAAGAFPIATYVLQPETRAVPVMAMIIATSTLIIAKHHQNISRLMAGTESKFGSKSAPANTIEAEHSA